MGLGPAAVKLYLELQQQGIFKNIKSVMDLGSQELHLKKLHFEELINASGIVGYKEEVFKHLANWPGEPRVSAKLFYELLGVKKYSSIDLNGAYGAVKHDLNLPFQEQIACEQYDLVTDHGANEHVFNIAQAYRTMHRLCKKQGFMIIAQAVYKGNGYYLFDASFFEGLAAANNYRVVFSSYIVTVKDDKQVYLQFHIPLSQQLLEAMDWLKTESIGICYVLQKQLDSEFCYPYQGEYLAQKQGNFGYRLQFLSSPSSYNYIPVYSEDLNNVKTNILLRLLFKRMRQKLMRIFKK